MRAVLFFPVHIIYVRLQKNGGALRAHVTLFIDKNINTKRRANIRQEISFPFSLLLSSQPNINTLNKIQTVMSRRAETDRASISEQDTATRPKSK